AALALGLGVGLFVGGALAAIPGGVASLRADPERDAGVAAALIAGAIGVGVAAMIGGAGQFLLIGKMQSQKLATIGAAGRGAIAAVRGAIGALAAVPPLRRLTRALPRPPLLGTSGLVLLAFVAGGALAVVAALSRADWRVLDLGPLEAIAVAGVL